MSSPVDFGGMSRMLESTLQALNTARGVNPGGPQTEDGEPLKDGDSLKGHGEALEGQISVDALPGGRIADLKLDPRVLRMDSITLCEAIVTAANAALTDLQEKLRANIAGPNLNALADQLVEVQQESARQMGSFLQALTDAQERLANTAGRSS
jgi:hypothetical protein